MNNLIVAGRTALILFLAVAGASAEAADDHEAIRTLIERTEAANNAGDAETWVGLFSDDAVYMPPGSPEITTRAGLVEVAEAGFRHDAAIEVEPIEIHVSGDWAFARSRVSGTVTLARSREVVDVDMKQIVIYTRDGSGEWKIARMINNRNAPDR